METMRAKMTKPKKAEDSNREVVVTYAISGNGIVRIDPAELLKSKEAKKQIDAVDCYFNRQMEKAAE